MNKTKKYVSIMIILFLIFANSIVNAASFSCSLKMQPSKSTIKAGDTVNINVIVDKITLSDNAPGLTIFDGYLDYDSAVFEDIKKSSIDCGDNRSVTYNSETKRIYVEYDNKNGLITANNTQIFTITMKVKEDANIENTKVTLKNITVTDNNQEVKIESISTQLTKDGGNTSNPSDSDGDNDNNNNGNNNDNISSDNNSGNNQNGSSSNNGLSNNSTNKNTTKNNTINDSTTTKTKSLPKAGLAQYGIMGIIVVAVIGMVSYVLYKKIAKDVK